MPNSHENEIVTLLLETLNSLRAHGNLLSGRSCKMDSFTMASASEESLEVTGTSKDYLEIVSAWIYFHLSNIILLPYLRWWN